MGYTLDCLSSNGKYTLLAKGTCLEYAMALSWLWMPHILFT